MQLEGWLVIALGISIAANGFLWTYSQTYVGFKTKSGGVFDIKQLAASLWEYRSLWDAPEIKVYVAGPNGIQPMKSLFVARLGNQQALIIEGSDDDAKESA